MHLNNLCLSLPADVDDIKPPPPPPQSPPLQPPLNHQKLKKPTFSSRLRRCFATNNRRCLSCITISCYRTHDTSHFEDISGAAPTGYDNPRLFSYAELYIGSNGFGHKELLGSGGFGRVYRAVLPSDGSIVAVKCVANAGDRFEKTFAAELAAVAQLRHRNLVKLRGWCVHDHQLLLVYDYMPNGSLDRLLFTSKTQLSFTRREKIVAGLAAALFYLHEQLDTQIIHRDVKTSNVMLDADFNAKLGDFGLARWLEHDAVTGFDSMDMSTRSTSMNANYQFRLSNTSRIGGTVGYLPPECACRSKSAGAITAKSDVYSFGVVVLELATGRRAVDLSYPDDEILMLDWVRRLWDEGRAEDAGDSRLGSGCHSVSDVKRLVHLGLLCSLHEQSKRPTMKWVMEVVRGNFAGELPALPSFKAHPYYVSLSSSSNSSSGSSRSGKSEVGSYFYTATRSNSTVYLTADDREGLKTGEESRQEVEAPVVFPAVDAPRDIPFKEIVSITNNFSEDNMVAELDFGTGYLGHLEGRPVLVKRLGMKTCPALRARFSDELHNLGRLRHRHLVQLRGWCTEQGEMLVIYDHPSSTLLSRRLFSQPPLPWPHRLALLRSLASGVLYLHEEWDQQVIHRNITSSAVFLDKDGSNPKLGCFALAEFLTRTNDSDSSHHHVSTGSVRGIFGYMAPEYVETGEATAEGDVYGFGVVVLEVVTGEMAVDLRGKEVLLAGKVRGGEAAVDRRMEWVDEREVGRVLELGLACTASEKTKRPSMREVVSVLDGNEEVWGKVRGRGWEGREEWGRSNGVALGMVRRMQALGIQ